MYTHARKRADWNVRTLFKFKHKARQIATGSACSYSTWCRTSAGAFLEWDDGCRISFQAAEGAFIEAVVIWKVSYSRVCVRGIWGKIAERQKIAVQWGKEIHDTGKWLNHHVAFIHKQIWETHTWKWALVSIKAKYETLDQSYFHCKLLYIVFIAFSYYIQHILWKSCLKVRKYPIRPQEMCISFG